MLAGLKVPIIAWLTDLGASRDNINSGLYILCGGNSNLSESA